MSKAATKLPVLYSFRRCPYAMRARLALRIAGVELEHREILLKNKPPAMLAVSPKGTVPVLVLPNGEVLDESIDVARWALAQSDPDDWLEPGWEAIEPLITQCDGPFKTALDRYKYHVRFTEKTQQEWFESALPVLREWETLLAANEGQGLLAARRSLADWALLPFLRQFANVDPARFEAEPLPLLQRWLEDFLEAELFKAVMEKKKLWEWD